MLDRAALQPERGPSFLFRFMGILRCLVNYGPTDALRYFRSPVAGFSVVEELPGERCSPAIFIFPYGSVGDLKPLVKMGVSENSTARRLATCLYLKYVDVGLICDPN